MDVASRAEGAFVCFVMGDIAEPEEIRLPIRAS
jgi:hypothetical protein